MYSVEKVLKNLVCKNAIKLNLKHP
jgi:hypothetical protein